MSFFDRINDKFFNPFCCRNGDNIASVSAYCRKLVDAIHKIFDGDSNGAIMNAVMKMEEANSFGRFLLQDELLDRFFNDYFFIKRSGLIPSYIAQIDRMLRRLRRSPLYDRILKEYRQTEQADEVQAKEKIDRQFDELDCLLLFLKDWEEPEREQILISNSVLNRAKLCRRTGIPFGMAYMLEHNVKLEQEIVSLTLQENGFLPETAGGGENV